MRLTTWKDAPDGKIYKRDVVIRLLLELVDEQIRTCTYIHTCDTLFTGEEMVLACFSFTKSF